MAKITNLKPKDNLVSYFEKRKLDQRC